MLLFGGVLVRARAQGEFAGSRALILAAVIIRPGNGGRQDGRIHCVTLVGHCYALGCAPCTGRTLGLGSGLICIMSLGLFGDFLRNLRLLCGFSFLMIAAGATRFALVLTPGPSGLFPGILRTETDALNGRATWRRRVW